MVKAHSPLLVSLLIPTHPTNCCTGLCGSNSVSVIDIATNTVVATIPVGVVPYGVAITGRRRRDCRERCEPDGTRAYVANVSSNNVSVIDIATNTVVATIPVGLIPVGVAITPDGTRAYVINAAGPCLIIFCTTIWHKSV